MEAIINNYFLAIFLDIAFLIKSSFINNPILSKLAINLRFNRIEPKCVRFASNCRMFSSLVLFDEIIIRTTIARGLSLIRSCALR